MCSTWKLWILCECLSDRKLWILCECLSDRKLWILCKRLSDTELNIVQATLRQTVCLSQMFTWNAFANDSYLSWTSYFLPWTEVAYIGIWWFIPRFEPFALRTSPVSLVKCQKTSFRGTIDLRTQIESKVDTLCSDTETQLVATNPNCPQQVSVQKVKGSSPVSFLLYLTSLLLVQANIMSEYEMISE